MTGLCGGTCTINCMKRPITSPVWIAKKVGSTYNCSMKCPAGPKFTQPSLIEISPHTSQLLLDEMPPKYIEPSLIEISPHLNCNVPPSLSKFSQGFRLSLSLSFPFQFPIPSNLIEQIEVLHFDLLRVSSSCAAVFWFVFWLFQPLMSLNYAFIWSFHFSFWRWRWLEVNFHSILP